MIRHTEGTPDQAPAWSTAHGTFTTSATGDRQLPRATPAVAVSPALAARLGERFPRWSHLRHVGGTSFSVHRADGTPFKAPGGSIHDERIELSIVRMEAVPHGAHGAQVLVEVDGGRWVLASVLSTPWVSN